MIGGHINGKEKTEKEKKGMLKRRLIIFLSLSFFIFAISFISAVSPVIQQQFPNGFSIRIPVDNVLKVGQPYNFVFYAENISNGIPENNSLVCFFKLYDNFGNVRFSKDITTPDSSGRAYVINVSGGNFSEVENLYYHIACYRTDLIAGGYNENILYVTRNGIGTSIYPLVVYIVVISLFVILMIALSITKNKIEFGKLEDKIKKLYEDKNSIKAVLYSLLYSFAKDTFFSYYLIVLLILIFTKTILITYSIVEFLNILDIILGFYMICSLFVGLIFLGKIQEFFSMIKDELSEKKWGGYR